MPCRPAFRRRAFLACVGRRLSRRKGPPSFRCTKFAVAAHRLQQNTNKILAFVRADLSNEYYTCLGDPAMCPFVESQTLGGSRAEVRVSGAWLEGARCFLPPFSSHVHAQSPPSGFPIYVPATQRLTRLTGGVVRASETLVLDAVASNVRRNADALSAARLLFRHFCSRAYRMPNFSARRRVVQATGSTSAVTERCLAGSARGLAEPAFLFPLTLPALSILPAVMNVPSLS